LQHSTINWRSQIRAAKGMLDGGGLNDAMGKAGRVLTNEKGGLAYSAGKMPSRPFPNPA
jgi:hypothetical protein